MHHAVAVDLGATSVRFAAGTLMEGRIRADLIKQVPNVPQETAEGPRWNVETLLGICRDAEAHARSLGPDTTLGIDSWGVDHGFLNDDGALIQAPVCYRDPAHAVAFERLSGHRSALYAVTGTQAQPFNTLYQLAARAEAQPSLVGTRWLILPELLAHLLGAPAGHELTQASTTNLLGLNDDWNPDAFAAIGWPVPNQAPQRPGSIVGHTSRGVRVARVGGHDTASAVCGIGSLGPDQAFLNVGTWSLLGTLLDAPLATPGAESANFTNERAVDGRVRFLANIPGFWVINRLQEELGVASPVPVWLNSANLAYPARVDLMDQAFFNPTSMLEAVAAGLPSRPDTPEDWAGVALGSLIETTVRQIGLLADLTGRRFRQIRVAGGGSASAAFCQALASTSGLEVVAGPQEATVLGNLGVQFLAQGAIQSFAELGEILLASLELKTYAP